MQGVDETSTTKPVLPLIELYSTKIDSGTKKFFRKVCIVARNELQQGFGDTRAPVVGIETIRELYWLAVCSSCKPLQADVSNTFLYRDTSKEIYLRIPLDHPKAGKERFGHLLCPFMISGKGHLCGFEF